MVMLTAVSADAQSKGTKRSGTKAQTTQHKGGGNRSGKKKGKQTYTNAQIRGLESERSQVQKDIKDQQNKLRANKADVEERLKNLLSINGEITAKQKDIDDYESEIQNLNGDIRMLQSQLGNLQQQLDERKEKYVQSMRYMAKHRAIQDRLMFIFSAKSLAQAYRRMRFVREYASYERAQGEQIKIKQGELNHKNSQLENVKGNKSQLLSKGKAAQQELRQKQEEQQQMVNDLQKEQRTIQTIISEQERKNAQLNAEIDRLIAVEIEKARARAAAEAQRKAEAAAAKKRAEELARKKAAAEAAARENARRIAEAKAREAEMKAAAERRAAAEQAAARAAAERRAAADAAARKAAAEQAAAEQAAREDEANRLAAERKASAEAQRHAREMAEVEREEERMETLSDMDRKISGSFENNRGRLPMPITGSYKIVSHFGQYNVEGLKNVKLDNKGINILGQPGSSARSIFDGEVSAVFNWGGQLVVMVRHGEYISVYCNLKSVHVKKGQKVTTRQVLGTVGQDNILQFQLRKETAKLNPEVWLGR